ncbi:hypothetical protein F383_23357 [Gossypium arboreum]|uniref:Uncharacterized protein n=1 Tax=Gossypium arboreum TaxID=29729 RepID=A0A0B0NWK1_GOSAR|nr:hypothetical protein F383_23357 [Gossypium arboreum]
MSRRTPRPAPKRPNQYSDLGPVDILEGANIILLGACIKSKIGVAGLGGSARGGVRTMTLVLAHVFVIMYQQ